MSVWSVHPEVQDRIAGSAVDGALLSGGHDDAVGVFLDNGSGWKTDTFLTTDLTVESARCDGGTAHARPAPRPHLDPAGRRRLAARSTWWATAAGSTGLPPGVIRQRVSVYSPVGGHGRRRSCAAR